MPGIIVIGGGPAGSVFASRMAELGHRVTLVERERFPRRHLGESLSPGVLPLLDSLGARRATEDATPVREVLVHWDGPARVRTDPRAEGLLVDREVFDQRLLDHARGRGVRILQPARLLEAARTAGGWRARLDIDGRTEQHRADFLAHAGGRSGPGRSRPREAGCRTLALFAYWRGARLPGQPRIEAGKEAWYWGVPLPSGLYNTLVFTDPATLRGMAQPSLAERFAALLARSGLMRGCEAAAMDGPVRAIDATACLHGQTVSPESIRVGDAAVALDPVSSTGVQKAIQTALAAAVTANTLLRKLELTGAATEFYESSLCQTYQRHRRWTAQYFGQVARERASDFWQRRASGAGTETSASPPQATARSLATGSVWLSKQLEIAELPCLDGDFVALRRAVRHPALDGPIAYLGGQHLAPLLAEFPGGLTPLEIARSWSNRVPLKTGLAILAWLVNTGLVSHESPDSCIGRDDRLRIGVAQEPRVGTLRPDLHRERG